MNANRHNHALVYTRTPVYVRIIQEEWREERRGHKRRRRNSVKRELSKENTQARRTRVHSMRRRWTISECCIETHLFHPFCWRALDLSVSASDLCFMPLCLSALLLHCFKSVSFPLKVLTRSLTHSLAPSHSLRFVCGSFSSAPVSVIIADWCG